MSDKQFDTIEVIVSIGSQARGGECCIGRPEGSLLPQASGTGNVVFCAILHEHDKPDEPKSKEQVKAHLLAAFDIMFEKVWAEVVKFNGA